MVNNPSEQSRFQIKQFRFEPCLGSSCSWARQCTLIVSVFHGGVEIDTAGREKEGGR